MTLRKSSSSCKGFPNAHKSCSLSCGILAGKISYEKDQLSSLAIKSLTRKKRLVTRIAAVGHLSGHLLVFVHMHSCTRISSIRLARVLARIFRTGEHRHGNGVTEYKTIAKPFVPPGWKVSSKCPICMDLQKLCYCWLEFDWVYFQDGSILQMANKWQHHTGM